METTLRRLYVGGIGSSVTDAELSERFGRFGKVDDVDIICRKDDKGNIIKTFAYMNISISDADLKKCLSVLNKAKWKGGVLQIEMAKESFLHKLEQERQAAKEKKKKPKEQSDLQNDLLQSLEKAGVTDFQMKAAVPGTEVPNHKNWVVSKYGRVLPVLHLKGNKQSKIMKYDPSKYCHNLKKLDNISLESTPVSQLTWHLDGGDDDISKKRKGEFPKFRSPVKKKKVNSLNISKTGEKGKGIRTPQIALQKAKEDLEPQHKRDTFQDKSRGYKGRKSINSMSDVEYDSEEELKAILERETMVIEGGRHAEDSNIEVVDDSFTPSYNTHWAKEIGKQKRSDGSNKDDNGYVSDDTDEIITVAKTTQNTKNCKKGNSSSAAKQNSNVVSTDLNISKYNVNHENEESSQSNDSDAEDRSDSYSDEEYESMMQNCYRLDLSMGDLEAMAKEANESDKDNTDENSDSDRESDSTDTGSVIAEAKCVRRGAVSELKGSNGHQTTKEKQKSKAVLVKNLEPGNSSKEQSSESSISHSEAKSGSMKQDLSSANLSVAKLKSLEKSVSKSLSSDDDDTDVTREDEKAVMKTWKVTKSYDSSAGIGNLKRKKGIEPEDIVAAILDDDDDDDDDESSNEQPKWKKKKDSPSKPPAFKGLGSLMSSLSVCNETKAPLSASKSCDQPTTVVVVSQETKANSTSSESKVKQDFNNKGEWPSKSVKKKSTDVHQRIERDDSSSGSNGSDESSSDEESSSATSPVTKPKVSQKSSSKGQINSKAKQLQDNQKRLAAMEERRKEREQQKQAIKGALLKLDSQSAKKSKHIMFNSESEAESEKEEASTSNVHSDKKTKHIKAKLFDSSGEDSDDEEEKDDERFEIKAQYEGRSGEKLMQLQSRFGTDERFKMDARFLEESSQSEEDTEQPQKIQADDDGLSAEKKKNLDILQSVLNINVEPQATSKKAANAKKFKDLNALQYDPTKEDHAVFETIAEEEKKESKSQRKKKRLEAEKLPDVSKEIFHEVIVDFKEVFGATKPEPTLEPTWDQMEEPQKMEVESAVSNVDLGFQKTKEPAGFQFSFFGSSRAEIISQDEPYKTETIKAAKVAWQEDPRFQDSSSEEGEEEETTVPTVSTSSQLEKSSSIRFFFFVKDDVRLKEGPKMFFRSSKSEKEAKDWDHMRGTLMEECKKRHRDAKKKLKSKH